MASARRSCGGFPFAAHVRYAFSRCTFCSPESANPPAFCPFIRRLLALPCTFRPQRTKRPMALRPPRILSGHRLFACYLHLGAWLHTRCMYTTSSSPMHAITGTGTVLRRSERTHGLTVTHGRPRSHTRMGWEEFTDGVIRDLNADRSGLIFMLRGRDAKTKTALIDPHAHHVLATGHPLTACEQWRLHWLRPFWESEQPAADVAKHTYMLGRAFSTEPQRWLPFCRGPYSENGSVHRNEAAATISSASPQHLQRTPARRYGACLALVTSLQIDSPLACPRIPVARTCAHIQRKNEYK